RRPVRLPGSGTPMRRRRCAANASWKVSLQFLVGKSIRSTGREGEPAFSQSRDGPKESARRRRFLRNYFILPSRYSTCFFAIGSYFVLTSLSVMVREFFRVT